VTYASETWVLKETIIQKLLVFERKILRRIFGSTKENQIWRVKTNEELDKLIKHKNIIDHIKAQRLSWFGHVQRMPDTRTVKKIFNWKPLTKRSQGRPKYRWKDNIKQDICQMKIKNWIACVQDRGKWKEVAEKAKTFTYEVQRLEEVVLFLFVLFYVLFVCKCVLPQGDNPIAVNKYIIYKKHLTLYWACNFKCNIDTAVAYCKKTASC
jgi:hypothetical protein